MAPQGKNQVASGSGWQRGSVDPFLLACETGRLDEARRLFAAGLDVNAAHPPNPLHGRDRRSPSACGSPALNAGVTPLMCASRSGHLDIVRALLDEFGADIAVQDLERWNALHYSCFSGHADISALLVERGCSQSLVSMFEKAKPVDFARHRRFSGACVACGDTVLPSAMTDDERRAVITKCQGKLAAAEESNEPLLHRYRVSSDVWASLRRFLTDGAREVVCHPAFDLLTGQHVALRWSGDHTEHLAFVAEQRESGGVVLRASSVSALQHFAVLDHEDAHNAQLPRRARRWTRH